MGLAVLKDLLGLVAHHGVHRGQHLACAALAAHHGDQSMQDRDELIGSALLTPAVVREGFFAVVVDLGHAFDEGLAQVVEGAGHLRPDEGGGERVRFCGWISSIRAASRLFASAAKCSTLT